MLKFYELKNKITNSVNSVRDDALEKSSNYASTKMN